MDRVMIASEEWAVRVSRWGWSRYETAEALRAEAQLLGQVVDVVGPRTDAEIVTVNSGTRVDADLLDQVPSAQLVLTTTSGYDHLDLAEIGRRGIQTGRCPQARRDAVVESSLGLLLDGLRCHSPLAEASRQGRWARGDLPQLGMRLLKGATIGVIGLGVIGSRVSEVLRLLGANVVGHDPRLELDRGAASGIQRMQLQELPQHCDAVTLHCRLEAGSRRIIDGAWLRSASQLVLVNTARGDIVDVDAAVRAVEVGHLQYLGLDVFPREPWSRLAASTHPRIVYLPHAAGFHVGLNAAVANELYEAVVAFVGGRPLPHPVVGRLSPGAA